MLMRLFLVQQFLVAPLLRIPTMLALRFMQLMIQEKG